MGDPVLQVRDLRVAFGTKRGVAQVVNGLDYELHQGQTLAIVGESGSGKSVSSMALMQLLPTPPARVTGTATYRGADLLGLGPAAIRAVRGNQLAMIFQDPMTSLNPVKTVGFQIMEPILLHLGLAKQEARSRAIELLELVGIPSPATRIDQYPHQFSGGMRQRVMIAIGLACEPDVLIADEPTTALDVTTQAQIIDEIRRLQERMGTSLIWITHDLGVVAGLADEVIVMYGGRIMESAPVGELYRGRHNPYTRGLLSSLPRTGAERPHRLAAIPGLPPDPITLPAGCPFAPRCPHVEDTCRDERPALRDTGDQHRSACHFEPQELYR
jgi:oligopeptide/dipeptide ABC transporter ATP-binding protein